MQSFLETDLPTRTLVQSTVDYLASPQAIQSIQQNSYWPKWNSPWWHMAVLYEMNQASLIPQVTIHAIITALQRQYPTTVFDHGFLPGKNTSAVTPCPCELGNIYQILAATKVDVDQKLPWIRSWFLRHQMPDGGLNCDYDAYHATPNASSMVATIAPLEAILFFNHRPLTQPEINFLDQGVQCLLDRKLLAGCSAAFNIEEKLDEADWLKLCFPRFYFYDVLRGLRLVTSWAETRNQPLAKHAINPTIEHLNNSFPDGNIKIERQAFADIGTRIIDSNGNWQRVPTASQFALLKQVSEVGQISPYLTKQWQSTRACIKRLNEKGLLK